MERGEFVWNWTYKVKGVKEFWTLMEEGGGGSWKLNNFYWRHMSIIPKRKRLGMISKVGKLISDILEITDSLQIDGLLMTIDIKTAFDSVNNFFLISVLKRYGFGDDFIKWIKTLLKNQESCFFNGRKTIRYFKHFQQTFSF